MKNRLQGRKGAIFPLLLLGLLSLAFLMAFLHFMGQEYAGQVSHAQEYLVVQAIGQSVFSQVLARIRNKPYAERFFHPQPFLANQEKLFGGNFDLFVVDTPGKPNQVDIYVNASYQQARRLFFWRVLIEHSILDAAGKVFPIIFSTFDSEKFPAGGTDSPFAAHIDQILTKRSQNKVPAGEKSAALATSTSLKNDLDILDGPSGEKVIDFVDPGAVPPPPSPTSPPVPPTGPLTQIFDDGFSDTPLGGYPAGWQNLVPGISGKIAQTDSGEKYLEMTAKPGWTRCDIIPVNLGEQFAYECEIEFPEATHGGAVGFQFYVLTGGEGYLRRANRFEFENEGNLHFIGDESSVALGNWSPNTRYTVRAEMDFGENRGKIYLNGELRGENVAVLPRSFNSAKHGGQVTLEKFGVSVNNVSDGKQPVAKVFAIRLYQ